MTQCSSGTVNGKESGWRKAGKQLRSGKLKLKKIKENKVPFPLPLDHQRIKREDVVIDRHTTSKKEPNPYRLEGDTGWI